MPSIAEIHLAASTTTNVKRKRESLSGGGTGVDDEIVRKIKEYVSAAEALGNDDADRRLLAINKTISKAPHTASSRHSHDPDPMTQNVNASLQPLQ